MKFVFRQGWDDDLRTLICTRVVLHGVPHRDLRLGPPAWKKKHEAGQLRKDTKGPQDVGTA